MSAPSDSAASPSPCACTNISLMQLFHELKQKFPGVPDHVVSNTIELYCHDKKACETHLHREVKASLTHAYHASSSAAARQLNEPTVNPPVKCRNQPIVKQEVSKTNTVNTVSCHASQTAVVSQSPEIIEDRPKYSTDANQNVVENVEKSVDNKNLSPITVINIDNCFAKYNSQSPSDLELTNEKKEVGNILDTNEFKDIKNNFEQPESTNYKILKSSKIKSNLNERLERVKGKKTIKKEESPLKTPVDKPQRPNTLNFIKPNPDIAFKEHSKESEPCRSVSPAPSVQKSDKEQKPGVFRPERGFPLNVSVNVNCHMDLSRGYGDPWLEDYDSPKTITSVNLTVCTPTSSMASPVRDNREDDGGFEGHVTVTVSPSSTRPTRRKAPPPPTSTLIESPRPSRTAPEPPGHPHDLLLIERQKERLSRLVSALAQEKESLSQLNRETQILAAPPPTASMTQRLKDYVKGLREECDSLSKRLEMGSSARAIPVPEPEDSGNFYSNIYTGQRPPSSWECHMCTFRNHPLLDKCEECNMPRIFVGTSPSTTHDSGFGSFRAKEKRRTSKTSLPEVLSDRSVVNV